MSNQVANTILEQLGGNLFVAMTGATNFLGREDGISFKIGRNAKGITHLRITLTAMDDYQVEFLKIRGVSIKPVAFREGLQAANLADVFRSVTGLETSLGTMGR